MNTNEIIKMEKAIANMVAKGKGETNLVKLARKTLENMKAEQEPKETIEEQFQITVQVGRSGEKHHPAICTKITREDGKVEYKHITMVCRCGGSRQGTHMTVTGETYAKYNCRKTK